VDVQTASADGTHKRVSNDFQSAGRPTASSLPHKRKDFGTSCWQLAD